MQKLVFNLPAGTKNFTERNLHRTLIKGDNLTLHRRPISQSTDCIRGKVGYRKGIHMWEIKWISNQRGTHACVGVATKKAPIRKVILSPDLTFVVYKN